MFIYAACRLVKFTYPMCLHIWNDYKKMWQNGISLFKNDMIEYITVLNSMAELVSCILNQFSDTWIFLSLDGFLGLDGKKLTDSGCSQFLSLESQVGGQYKLLSSG